MVLTATARMGGQLQRPAPLAARLARQIYPQPIYPQMIYLQMIYLQR